VVNDTTIRNKLAALERAATEAASEVVKISFQVEQRRGRDGVEELLERAKDRACNLATTVRRMEAFLTRHPEHCLTAPTKPMGSGETLTAAIRRWRVRISEVRETLLCCERAEASLVEQAIAAGQHVLYRHDASELAVLGCVISHRLQEEEAAA
jgi:hypothetical protein